MTLNQFTKERRRLNTRLPEEKKASLLGLPLEQYQEFRVMERRRYQNNYYHSNFKKRQEYNRDYKKKHKKPKQGQRTPKEYNRAETILSDGVNSAMIMQASPEKAVKLIEAAMNPEIVYVG